MNRIIGKFLSIIGQSLVVNILRQLCHILASYPGPSFQEEEEEKQPGTHCMHMHQGTPENWGNQISLYTLHLLSIERHVMQTCK